MSTVKSLFNHSRFNVESQIRVQNLATKTEYHIKKSRFCVKARFKESKCAEGAPSVNRDFYCIKKWVYVAHFIVKKECSNFLLIRQFHGPSHKKANNAALVISTRCLCLGREKFNLFCAWNASSPIRKPWLFRFCSQLWACLMCVTLKDKSRKAAMEIDLLYRIG